MNKDNSFSFWHLLWRSLLPSTTSFIWGSIFALLIIGLHLLLLSINSGVVLPHIFDSVGGWSNGSSQLLAPVRSTIHSSYANSALVVLLWGLVGWTVYEITSGIVTAARAVRDDRQTVYMPSEAHVVYHPLRRTLIVRIIWRFCVLVLAITAATLLQPLIHEIWVWDEQTMHVASMPGLLRLVGLAYISWLFILHVLLIFLRLFLFRTRVYGEVVR